MLCTHERSAIDNVRSCEVKGEPKLRSIVPREITVFGITEGDIMNNVTLETERSTTLSRIVRRIPERPSFFCLSCIELVGSIDRSSVKYNVRDVVTVLNEAAA